MFSETDEAYRAASRLMAATPEQLETHAVAMALRLNRAGEEFVQEMNTADRGTADAYRQGSSILDVQSVDGAETEAARQDSP